MTQEQLNRIEKNRQEALKKLEITKSRQQLMDSGSQDQEFETVMDEDEEPEKVQFFFLNFQKYCLNSSSIIIIHFQAIGIEKKIL